MASSRSRARKSSKVRRKRYHQRVAPASLREAENQAADRATETLAGATSELAKAIVAAPAPIMASGIEQAKIDLVDYKNHSVLYINGSYAGRHQSGDAWAIAAVLRSLAKTGCITVTETDLSHLQGE